MEEDLKKNVLVVDDNELNLKLACDILEINDYNAIRRSSGEEALEFLKQNIPDLILLDISLPGMDGYEILKHIRSDSRLDRIKVIAITASVMLEDETRMKCAGFDEYIGKPINMKDFLSKVQKGLEQDG